MRLPQEVEGVTKFDLVFTASVPLPSARLYRLIEWRTKLYRAGLIGLDPRRYGGVGFGNVSQRLTSRVCATEPRFAVSGTQTGGLAVVGARHFAIVNACDPERNCVEAEGPIAPSSESLTHGMLYRLDPRIGFVLHVHCPAIWRNARRLGLARTQRHVAYGTPAMAHEMKRLWANGTLRLQCVLAMEGHEDGVIAYGRDVNDAGTALLRAYAESAGPR